MANNKEFIFIMTCPDTVGIVAAVTTFIMNQGGFICSSSHYGDPSTNRFFMRTVFQLVGAGNRDRDSLRREFQPIADKYSMQWDIHDKDYRPKVLIAVSKFGHCLNDLLHKTKTGQIGIDIPAVVSNHLEMREIVEWYNIPYYHLPITKETKQSQEQKIIKMIDDLKINLVVLARYMQILSPEATQALSGRCINIHHSFLPSFKGAAPYQQAYNRGVKLIGATAHYVTSELDEGPIVEQAVERVDHSFSLDDIIMTGRDLETVVLSRAVKWHIEHRVLLNGNKTVVFK
jgi:formyltetrahydrofolate deformylase